MAETLLERLRDLLKEAPPDGTAFVTIAAPGVPDLKTQVPVRELLPTLDEEIDRVAERAGYLHRIEDLEFARDNAEQDAMDWRGRVWDLERALIPFADAGKRFHITEGGSMANALRYVTEQDLRAAMDAEP